jgi:GNAT superfamily N-acetyltransferase
VARVSFTREEYRSEVALQMMAGLLADLNRRYGPGEFGPVDESRFRPPDGVFLVAWLDGRPIGSGAFWRAAPDTAELKRMYVSEEMRRGGVGKAILDELEQRARMAGYARVQLETGVGQPEAIGLYESAGYTRIPCYPPYDRDPDSICFERRLAG